MNIEAFREYCISKPCATEDFPFDETLLAFRVKKHIFACISLDYPDLATMKCDPEKAIELRDRYSAIEPAYHWNKKFWNQIWFNRDVDDEMLKRLVDHSYDEVVKKLSKKGQSEIK